MGCSVANFRTIASLTALARFSRQLLDQALGNLALHRAVGVPLDDDPRGAELAGELADFFDDEADVGVVELFDFLAVVPVARDLLVEIPRFGKKWMTTVLVRISSFSPWIDPAVAGANLMSYSFFCEEYFGSRRSFWMIEKSITWSNGGCSVTA